MIQNKSMIQNNQKPIRNISCSVQTEQGFRDSNEACFMERTHDIESNPKNISVKIYKPNTCEQMNTTKSILTFISILYFGISSLLAQKNIGTSGGISTGNEGNISYTIGQLFIGTYESVEGSVSQGVQQPYEISVLIGLSEYPEISLHCEVYPNPTTDKLILTTETDEMNELSAILTDMDGRLMHQLNITTNSTSIDMSGLKPAVYYLTLFKRTRNASSSETNSRTTIKSFKIIKL